MKRFALVLAVVGALAVFGTVAANAADNHYGHGNTSYAHGYAGFGQSLQYGYFGHRYVAPVYGHDIVQYGYALHGYAAPAYGGHGYYPSYGHGGGVLISTPHFGLRIGH